MRLLATADLHLGFLQGTKLTKGGINQRSADCAQSFSRFVDRAIDLRPDVIAVAGDIYHFAKPSNHALVHAMREFGRLTKALPETIVLVIAGNHDLGKVSDTGCALPILEHVGVHVVTHRAMRVAFPERALSVLCVPDVIGLNRPELTPDANARFNLLVLHGEAQGVTQGGANHRVSANEISTEEMGADRFSFVALGHYHAYERLADNVAYSGSLDFCSSNPWGELATPKGFIEHDLDTGAHAFHELPPSRPFYDLPRVDATGLTPAEVDAAIAERVQSIELRDAVVRCVVEGITLDVQKAIDQRAIRGYRTKALSFALDFRRADVLDVKAHTEMRRAMIENPRSLSAILGGYIDRRDLSQSPDVDRGELRSKALEYLAMTEPKDGDAMVTTLPDEEGDSLLERQLSESINQNLLQRSA